MSEWLEGQYIYKGRLTKRSTEIYTHLTYKGRLTKRSTEIYTHLTIISELGDTNACPVHKRILLVSQRSCGILLRLGLLRWPYYRHTCGHESWWQSIRVLPALMLLMVISSLPSLLTAWYSALYCPSNHSDIKCKCDGISNQTLHMSSCCATFL